MSRCFADKTCWKQYGSLEKGGEESLRLLPPPERAAGGFDMKCFCTNCFDTEEIIDYIELFGEFGQCPACNSRSVNRIRADRIGRFLRTYLADAYIDCKAGIGQPDQKQKDRLEQWAEQQGWQSIEEIFIEDKAIFSAHIPLEIQKTILTDIFSCFTWEDEAYADIKGKRFLPKKLEEKKKWI